MSITFIQYAKCSTCQKAKKWLDDHGAAYEAIHIAETPPTKEELKAIYEKSGLPLTKLFNTSGMKYRELGLKDKLKGMSEDEIIKRPIAYDGEKATIGFKEENFESVWA